MPTTSRCFSFQKAILFDTRAVIQQFALVLTSEMASLNFHLLSTVHCQMAGSNSKHTFVVFWRPAGPRNDTILKVPKGKSGQESISPRQAFSRDDPGMVTNFAKTVCLVITLCRDNPRRIQRHPLNTPFRTSLLLIWEPNNKHAAGTEL